MSDKPSIVVGRHVLDDRPRQLDLGTDDVLVEERSQRLSMRKVELLAYLETAESQIGRMSGYLTGYQAIQEKDRRDIRRLERQLADDQHEMTRENRIRFGEMVVGHLDMLDVLAPEGSPLRMQGAMRAVRHIEAAMRVGQAGILPVWTAQSYRVVVSFRTLCQAARYLPRPDTTSAALYMVDEPDIGGDDIVDEIFGKGYDLIEERPSPCRTFVGIDLGSGDRTGITLVNSQGKVIEVKSL